jgi:hypothetical protein
MAWVLCSKADVASIHPISESALPDFWSEAVEQMIREYLSSPSLGLEQSTTGAYSGDGTPVLAVRTPPILSVESLSIDGLQVPADSFVVNKTTVQLKVNLVFTPGKTAQQRHLWEDVLEVWISTRFTAIHCGASMYGRR